MEDPLRGLVGPGLYLLVLSLYWLLQAAYALEKTASARRDGHGRMRRWKFGKGDRAGSGSPTSTADSGLTASAGDRLQLANFGGLPSAAARSLWCVRLQRWPVEPLFRTLLSVVALASEAALSALNGEWPGDLSRSTLYALFCMSGLVDLLHSFRILYPAGTGQLLLVLAFAAETCLIGDVPPSQNGASFPGLVVMGLCSGAVLMEIWQNGRQQDSLRLLRAYLVAWQGSWLVHLGLRLIIRRVEDEALGTEVPVDTPEPPKESVTVLAVFFWHAILVFVVASVLVALVKLCRKVCCGPYSQGGTVSARLAAWCPCGSVDEFPDSFRRSPMDDFEETEPLAMHP